MSVLFVLTACSGGSGESTSSATAAERLETAATTLSEAEGLTIGLTTEQLPSGVSGLLSAKGEGNHSPAFAGTVTVSAGGSSIDAEVIAVGGKVWVKTGFSPDFLTIDPATLGAPDPAALVGTGPGDGLLSLFGATADPTAGKDSRDGAVVLTTITGTVPGSTVVSLLSSADEDASYQVEYRLTDDDELHDATITGPFYGGSSVTYRLTMSPTDGPVSVEAPVRPGA